MLELIQTMDASALLWIQENVRQAFLDPLVCFYTTLGNAGIGWIVLSILLLFHPKTRKAGALSLLAMSFGALCTNVILKNLVGRPRPWLDVPGLVALVNETDPNSFPSGHTCAALACSLIWLRTMPRRWVGVLSVVMAVLMALSRLYVGVHYPSDVLAGAVVGTVCAWCAWKAGKAWEKRRSGRL